MHKMAEAVKAKLIAAGADKVEILQPKVIPLCTPKKLSTKNYQPCLYTDHDVSPADPLELWHSLLLNL